MSVCMLWWGRGDNEGWYGGIMRGGMGNARGGGYGVRG